MSRRPTARRNHRIMSPPTLPALRQPHPSLSLQARLLLSLGMAPVLVPLRPSSNFTDDPSKLARYLFSDGDDRPSTVRSFLTRPLARRDVPLALVRAFKFANPLGEWPRLPSTVRIERPPLHRGSSASKKGTWPLPSHPSEAARCASTEDHQAPSRPLLREQGISTGVIPPLFLPGYPCRQRCRSHRFTWRGSAHRPARLCSLSPRGGYPKTACSVCRHG